MNQPLAIRSAFLWCIFAIVAGSAAIGLAQYPATSGYPQTQYRSPPPQDNGTQYNSTQYRSTEYGNQPSYQDPRYQNPQPQQYRQGAPVVRGSEQNLARDNTAWQQPQPYNQPYTRSRLSDASPQTTPNNRFGNPDAGYPATDSLGPFNDFRQQQQFQPDFSRRPQAPPAPRRELFEEARQIAIVVDEPILAGDLLGDIEQILAPYKNQATEEQLDEQRQLLMQKLLPQKIQTKMLFQKMLSSVPPEAVPQIREKLNVEFDDKQLVNLMERAKVNTPAELDAKLREVGSSIEKQRRDFGEQVLARECVRQNVQAEPDVSHDEMLRYYQEHAEEYDRPLRLRWEELAVSFNRFDGNKAEAYRAIANMGNRVLRGAAFSRVAREQSQGFTADNGGWHDWTQPGTLKFTEVEEVLFDLPTNELSQIVESDFGFHIIRVLDREEAGRSPFFQEQASIKAKLQKEKRDKSVEEFIAKVRSQTRVWTIFDDQPLPVGP